MTPLSKLVREAYGCKFPEVRTNHLQDLVDYQIYSISLPEWQDAHFIVTLPTYSLMLRIAAVNPNFTPDTSWELMEAYFQDYKFQPTEALAYALATLNFQAPRAMDHLRGRFSRLLSKAQEMAIKWHHVPTAVNKQTS